MSKDWYERHLGTPAVTPQPRPDATPSRFAPMPGAWPTRAAPESFAPPHPSQTQAAREERFDPDAYAAMSQSDRIQYLQANTNAGPGTVDAQVCPNCGAEGLFSRRNTPGRRNPNVYPAPECFTCGWPNLQSGSMGVTIQGAG